MLGICEILPIGDKSLCKPLLDPLWGGNMQDLGIKDQPNTEVNHLQKNYREGTKHSTSHWKIFWCAKILSFNIWLTSISTSSSSLPPGSSPTHTGYWWETHFTPVWSPDSHTSMMFWGYHFNHYIQVLDFYWTSWSMHLEFMLKTFHKCVCRLFILNVSWGYLIS